MLCRLFFQIYIKIKTDITDIDIAESGKKPFFISIFIPMGYKLSLKNIGYSR